MALVVASQTSLKPELQLQQALQEYEAILSDEERKELHAQGSPDAMAAIKFATLIDNNCISRRSRCLGQRLVTFLETIQQFTQVVDTFVSAHPEVAALVWGGVKLALLVRFFFA